jgi:tRNA1Val (adenine37-N6)-methyltransferase
VSSAASTSDALFEGRVRLEQPARGAGYRVNVDALLLAEFACGHSRARVAFDLGAGVGGVALALLHADAVRRVVLVEIDRAAVDLAQRNIDANGWSERAEVFAADVRDAARDRRGEADLVVCNPPYTEPGRGRAPAPSRALARSGSLALFVEAARAVAGRRARICFVYPAQETLTLFETLRAAGLEPKRARYVHAKATTAARVILVEARAAKRGGLVVEAALVEQHVERSPRG